MRRRLEPLAEPGRTFRHTARELLALSAWRNHDAAAARHYIDMIAADGETPAGHARARRRALGADRRRRQELRSNRCAACTASCLLAALLALAPVLAGCEDFDMDKLDVFGLNKKKKLPGERKEVFPGGVPGVTQGIPPEYLKGNQPPPEPTPRCRRARNRAPEPQGCRSQRKTAASRRPKSRKAETEAQAEAARRRPAPTHSRPCSRRATSAAQQQRAGALAGNSSNRSSRSQQQRQHALAGGRRRPAPSRAERHAALRERRPLCAGRTLPMSFTVAIVGRPNVGKSTLFNRLVGRRLALVDDRPGVTRDRREGEARLGDLDFTVIDTAGPRRVGARKPVRPHAGADRNRDRAGRRDLLHDRRARRPDCRPTAPSPSWCANPASRPC